MQVMVLIENLRESFKEMITDLDWMEDKTKEYARDKVIQLFHKFFYRLIEQTCSVDIVLIFFHILVLQEYWVLTEF